MSEYTIRGYQTKDRADVEAVCTGCADEMWQRPEMKEGLLTVFCHYYIEKEPANCFVAESDGKVLGYILCAEDFDQWEKTFRAEYVEPSENMVVKYLADGTIGPLRPFAAEYPAHLHIDISPELQGKHAGTGLMKMLEAHLARKNVPGLCLCVAKDNIRARRFYEKLGFSELGHDEAQFTLGKRL